MTSSTQIPKIIHYCWFGGNDKSVLVKQCIESWKEKLPDYQIIEWNEDNYDFKNNVFLETAYERKMWAFVSDYVRLDVLLQYGGIYLDTDVETIKSFNPFLNHSFFTCFEGGIEKNNYLASTAVLGCIKGNELISSFLNFYKQLGNKEIVNFKTPNTKIFSNLLVEKYKIELENNLQIIKSNMYIYPNDYFCPKNWATKKIKITSNTCAIHHFDGSWKGKNEKLMILVSGKIRQYFGDNTFLLIKKILKK
ncbi:glycosyltransferase family 32 protein [Peribacillus simplex]|uniref:glycosyltransferase family 32 protein n=1 Tax=Peribacillus simplex TaxID=1478 RepID=UPI00366BC88E